METVARVMFREAVDFQGLTLLHMAVIFCDAKASCQP